MGYFFRFIEVTFQVNDPPRFMEVTVRFMIFLSQVYDIQVYKSTSSGLSYFGFIKVSFQVYESTSPGLCHFGFIKVPFQVYNSTSPGYLISVL